MRLSLFGVALSALLLASSVQAQPSPTSPDAPKETPGVEKTPEQKDAEQHFTRARQLYDEGDFALALVEFKRAYDLSPNYRVLYNIGQVNIQLFNYAAARTALEKYMQDGGAEISVARKSQTEADLKMLRERTAFIRVTSNPPAEVSVDDIPVGKTPFEEPLLVNAGQRKIIISHTGYVSVTKMVTLAGGDSNDVRVELVAVPKDKGTTIMMQTSTRPNYTPAVLCWIGAGTLGITAGVVGGFYLSKESEIERLSQPQFAVRRQDALDATASAQRLAIAADVLGLAALGAGLAALYFTLRPPRTEVTSSTGQLHITPTINGVTGTF